MLDVIHYFYEEDMNYASVEQLQMSDARRVHVFEDLYGMTYKYRSSSDSAGGAGINQFSGVGSADTKPYIPPTEFDPDSYNPFGSVLDAPIG